MLLIPRKVMFWLGVMCALPLPSKGEQWSTDPLGNPVTVTKSPPPVTQPLISRKEWRTEGWFFASAEDLREAVLITPAEYSRSAHAGAQLLQEYWKRLTGIEVPITNENRLSFADTDEGVSLPRLPDRKIFSRPVWLGKTLQAAARGISAEGLAPGGYRIATFPEGMILAGNDEGDQGTYHAAIALLEDGLGVRWLWPGETGTVLPKGFRLPRVTAKDEPALGLRGIRSFTFVDGRSEIGAKLLGRTPEQIKADYRDEGIPEWMRLQRLGGALQLRGGHAFGGWYERYGKEHPEWFALQPDNTRIQIGGRERLCVSNPEVAEEAARRVLEYLDQRPPGTIAPIAPNDGGSYNFFCMCEACRRLDPSNASKERLLFARGPKRQERFEVEYPSLSDRMAVFSNRIAEKVCEARPDARFTTYAYSAYRAAPLGIALHPAITVGFVGLSYFNEAARREDMNRWDAWANKASRLYLRPNLLFEGRSFPCNFTTAMAGDLRHCYETGMAGTDFDAITQDWATRGLNYYVLSRLLWDPARDPREIVEDYCRSGFGPAADAVKAYFVELEQATREVAEFSPEEEPREEEVAMEVLSARERMTRALTKAFNSDRLARLDQSLHEARQKADGDEGILERIEFLALGLEYARRQTETYEAGANKEVLKERMSGLLDFCRRVARENPLAINTSYLLWKENARFRILDEN